MVDDGRGLFDERLIGRRRLRRWAAAAAGLLILVRLGAELVPVLRVPEHAGSATLAWTGDRLTAAVTIRAEGDMPDSGGVRDGFVTANLNAAWRLTDQVELTARAENVTDETYQQLLGYGEPGRSGFVGVRLRY